MVGQDVTADTLARVLSPANSRAAPPCSSCTGSTACWVTRSGRTRRSLVRSDVSLGKRFNVLPLDEAVARLSYDSCRLAYRQLRSMMAIRTITTSRSHSEKTGLSATVCRDGIFGWWNHVERLHRRNGSPNGPRLDFDEFDLGSYPLETADDRRKAISGLISRIKYLERYKQGPNR